MGAQPRALARNKAAANHLEWAFTPSGQWVRVFNSTTVALPNRERDKQRVENILGLSEFGDGSVEIYAVRSGLLPVALGYERIVYGDHGPYVELLPHQICWSSFPNYIEKPIGFYDEYWTADGVTMLYSQRRHVTNKPNPPMGPWAAQNNRPEGYANYLIGRLYIACEADTIAVQRGTAKPRARRRTKNAQGVNNGGAGCPAENGAHAAGDLPADADADGVDSAKPRNADAAGDLPTDAPPGDEDNANNANNACEEGALAGHEDWGDEAWATDEAQPGEGGDWYADHAWDHAAWDECAGWWAHEAAAWWQTGRRRGRGTDGRAAGGGQSTRWVPRKPDGKDTAVPGEEGGGGDFGQGPCLESGRTRDAAGDKDGAGDSAAPPEAPAECARATDGGA